MTTIQLRPTFSTSIEFDSREVMKRVRAVVNEHSGEIEGRFTSHHAMISIVESDRHFWSPCLHLEVRTEIAGDQLFGRFSPHPSIWTGFMFAYLSLGILSFFSVILGVSQQMSSQSSWGYFLLLVWAFVAIGLWLISKAGQRLATDEMQSMKTLIDESLKEHASSNPLADSK